VSDFGTLIVEQVDRAAPPIDVDALVAGLVESSAWPPPAAMRTNPARSRWGRLAAVAILAAVIAGLVAAAWLLRDDDPTRAPAVRPFPIPVMPDSVVGEGMGSLRISVHGLVGMEGYRLLAVALDLSPGADERDGVSDVAGAALWTMVDSDPFSAGDQLHPPISPYLNTRDLPPSEWAAEDYRWQERAWLAPGAYRIWLSANPGELRPYGNLVPGEPIERMCWVEVEVAAGRVTEVVVSDIPVDGDRCPTEFVQASPTVAVTVTGLQGRDGWEVAGVLFPGGYEESWWAEAVGGFWVRATGDDFSTTQIVRRGIDPEQESLVGLPFPFVTDQAASAGPGLYTLMVWADTDLIPYNRWVPGVGEGFHLRGCYLEFEVTEGEQQTRVTVDGESLRNVWVHTNEESPVPCEGGRET